MMKRLLWTLLLAGVLSPSVGCHCLSQLLCCDTSGYGMGHGGCDSCGGVGCASCASACDSCGGAGCASCGGGYAGCSSCCFPILGGVVNWILHPCGGCESLYSVGHHGGGCGCESCAGGGPIQAPYNMNPYMDVPYDGMQYDGEFVAPPQGQNIAPTPANGSMGYQPRGGVATTAYQSPQTTRARAGSSYTAGRPASVVR